MNRFHSLYTLDCICPLSVQQKIHPYRDKIRVHLLNLKSIVKPTRIGEIKPWHGIEHVQSGVSAREIAGVLPVNDDRFRNDVSNCKNVAEHPTESNTKDYLQ